MNTLTFFCKKPINLRSIYKDSDIDRFKLFCFSNERKKIKIEILKNSENTKQSTLLKNYFHLMKNIHSQINTIHLKNHLTHHFETIEPFQFKSIFSNPVLGIEMEKIYNQILKNHDIQEIQDWLNNKDVQISMEIKLYWIKKNIPYDIEMIPKIFQDCFHHGWSEFLKLHRDTILNEFESSSEKWKYDYLRHGQEIDRIILLRNLYY